MDGLNGVQIFLVLPVTRGELSRGDIEKAIEISTEKSPSRAMQDAQVYSQIQHGSAPLVSLGFGKGVRWLTIIRRDLGQETFDEQCAKLRDLFH